MYILAVKNAIRKGGIFSDAQSFDYCLLPNHHSFLNFNLVGTDKVIKFLLQYFFSVLILANTIRCLLGVFDFYNPVSYTHLTLPTNREV